MISAKIFEINETSLVKQDYRNAKISMKLTKLSYFSDQIEGKHEVARERWCPKEMRRRKERWRVDRYLVRATENQKTEPAPSGIFPRHFNSMKNTWNLL